MFKSSYQSGFLSLLYSIGSKPLSIWSSEGALLGGRRRLPMSRRERSAPCCVAAQRICTGRRITYRTVHAVENGHIKRITDEDIQSSVLEVRRPAPVAVTPPISLHVCTPCR